MPPNPSRRTLRPVFPIKICSIMSINLCHVGLFDIPLRNESMTFNTFLV
jgi:hypothetical protein